MFAWSAYFKSDERWEHSQETVDDIYVAVKWATFVNDLTSKNLISASTSPTAASKTITQPRERERERERDRETNRETEGQTETQRDRQTDRQTETETDRQTERQAQREREGERETSNLRLKKKKKKSTQKSDASLVNCAVFINDCFYPGV